MNTQLRAYLLILALLFASTKAVIGADLQAGAVVPSTNTIEAGSAFASIEFTIRYQGPPSVRFARVTSSFFLSSNPTAGNPHEIYLGSRLSEFDFRAATHPNAFSRTVFMDGNASLAVPIETFEGNYYLVHRVTLTSLEGDGVTDPADSDPTDDEWVSSNTIAVHINSSMRAKRWHWLSPLPQGNHLRGVAYGGGTYVAVGDAGTILVSNDVADWRLIYGSTNLALTSIVYGDGNFLAGGFRTEPDRHPVVLVSSNGTAWAELALPISGFVNWYDTELKVAFGNGRSIAIAPHSSFLWTSTDIQHWRFQETAQTLRSLIFAHGLFVGSAYIGQVASPDGMDWMVTSPYGYSVALAYGEPGFVGVGYGYIQSSPDGWHWSLAAAPILNPLSGIVFGNARFVAVGDFGTIIVSSNGRTWAQVISESIADLDGVCYGSRGYIAVGQNGTILNSLDGTNWLQRSALSVEPLFAAATAGNLRVAVGLQGQILASTNQTNWINVSPLTDGALLDVVYGNGTFVAVGAEGAIVTSTNGLNWTPQLGVVANTISCIAFGQGVFVAGSDNAALVSTDGLRWASHAVFGPTNFIVDICYGDERFIAVSDSGVLFASTNGVVWTAFGARMQQSPRSIAAGNGRFVAITSDGHQIIASADGYDWTPPGMNLSPWALHEVQFHSGLFIAVGDHGTILTSTNGTSFSWLNENSGTWQDLYGIAFDSRFIVVGEGESILESAIWELPRSDLAITYDGAFHVSLHGLAGARYRLEASEDLINWRCVTEIALAAESAQWNQPNVSRNAYRFFRALFLGFNIAITQSQSNAPLILPAGSFIIASASDAGGTTIQIQPNNTYHATFSDNTTEDGSFNYVPRGDTATLVLHPTNNSGDTTANLTFSSPFVGSYTSDTIGNGTFALGPLPGAPGFGLVAGTTFSATECQFSTTTILIEPNNSYHAVFDDNTTEDGTFTYTPSGETATLVLHPNNNSGDTTITLTYSSLTTGTYTSDTIGNGTFVVTKPG